MMTWGEFRELFMVKFFPVSAMHANAREFLELKQGSMIVLEYVAMFTELARFGKCEEVLGWPEVVHMGQDCRISPTRHGLYG